VFTHKGSLIGSYQGFTTLPSKSRGQKYIKDLSKPYKYPSQDPEKELKKIGRKKRKRKEKNDKYQ
jgi:hypothetical protein